MGDKIPEGNRLEYNEIPLDATCPRCGGEMRIQFWTEDGNDAPLYSYEDGEACTPVIQCDCRKIRFDDGKVAFDTWPDWERGPDN